MRVLRNLFTKKRKYNTREHPDGRGLLIYNRVNDVIQAEVLLNKADFDDIRVVAPPPQYRTGCDLCLEIPIIEQIVIIRVLEHNKLSPEDIIQVNQDSIRPTEICKKKDFGEYIMVRAANMKLTFEKSSQKIVNISGGGCSDVPYLANEMIEKTLSEAPSPREIGYTLCAYSLAIAFEEEKNK